MNLWISGEIDSSVGNAFRETLPLVRSAVRQAISDVDYDIPLESWDCIAIIRNDDHFNEVTKYSKKKRDMDFRLRIDYKAFYEGDSRQRCKLFCDMLSRSLEKLKQLGVNGPEMDRLSHDFHNAVRLNNWE